MHTTFLAAMAAAMIGVDVGWQPLEDGGLEYLIQIEPHQLKTLSAGDTIDVGVRPELRDVRSYRIVIGTDKLPRTGHASQVSVDARRTTVQPQGPWCPVDTTEQSVDTTNQSVIKKDTVPPIPLPDSQRAWTAAPAAKKLNSESAMRPPTLTLNTPAGGDGSDRDTDAARVAGNAADINNGFANRENGASADWTQPAAPSGLEPRAVPSQRYADILEQPAPNSQPYSPPPRDAQPIEPGHRNAFPNPQQAPSLPPTAVGDSLPRMTSTPDSNGIPDRTAPQLVPSLPGVLPAADSWPRRPVEFGVDPAVVPVVGHTGSRSTPAPAVLPATNPVSSDPQPSATYGGMAFTPPVNPQQGTQAPDNPVASSPVASADAEPRPWLPLTLSLAALFASLGGNLYLGWMTMDIRRRFQHLANRLRRTGSESTPTTARYDYRRGTSDRTHA